MGKGKSKPNPHTEHLAMLASHFDASSNTLLHAISGQFQPADLAKTWKTLDNDHTMEPAQEEVVYFSPDTILPDQEDANWIISLNCVLADTVFKRLPSRSATVCSSAQRARLCAMWAILNSRVKGCPRNCKFFEDLSEACAWLGKRPTQLAPAMASLTARFGVPPLITN